jgi:hypothetical protein
MVCRTCLIVLFATFSAIFTHLAGAQTLQHLPAEELQPATAQVASVQNPASPSDEKPVLPEGACFQVEIVRPFAMKAGEAIEGRLMYPIYVADKLVVAANTPLHGQVLALDPDKKTRWEGRLRGDFTPFHIAEVRFDELELPAGPLKILSTTATHGAPVLQLSAPGTTRRRSFLASEWHQVVSQLHDRIAFFTTPGLGDRAREMLYHQLPYHPERIETHSAWSFELRESLTLPNYSAGLDSGPSVSAQSQNEFKPETWSIHAVLSDGVTSAKAKPGDPVTALVVEPVFDRRRGLVVPEGSTLVGRVTTAKPARVLGRNGKLRFTFQEIRFPKGIERQVEGSLASADTEKTQNLSLDAEGTVTPRNQASAIAPLLLTVLAGRALDQDGNMTADTGVASNGFGLVGRVVGIAAGNRNLAAGIGFYAAGLSFYENFLRTGRDVVFPKDTRIEIETSPLRAPVLKPEAQSNSQPGGGESLMTPEAQFPGRPVLTPTR